MNTIVFALLCTFDLALWLLQGGTFNPPLLWLSVGVLVVLILVFSAVEYRMGKPYREAQEEEPDGKGLAQYAPWKEWRFGKMFGFCLAVFVAAAVIEIATPPVLDEKISAALVLQCLLAAVVSALICTLVLYCYHRHRTRKAGGTPPPAE